jgi:hypothetical protein
VVDLVFGRGFWAGDEPDQVRILWIVSYGWWKVETDHINCANGYLFTSCLISMRIETVHVEAENEAALVVERLCEPGPIHEFEVAKRRCLPDVPNIT